MTAEPALIVHTTEGDTIASAVKTMRANKSECHEVCDPANRSALQRTPRIASLQLVPWTQPARSLRHPRGTPETNNRGYTVATSHLGKVYQVEVVGYANKVRDGEYADLWWRGLAEYLSNRCARLGVPVRFPYPFGGVEGYGVRGAYRLTWAEWEKASGILGHCHVPANSHWDPSDIKTPLLPLMTGSPPMAEITFPASRDATIRRIQAALGVEVDGDPYIVTAAAAESMQREVDRLKAKADTQGAEVIRLKAEVVRLHQEVARLEGGIPQGWTSFVEAVREATQR